MLKGIGTDIIEIERIELAISRGGQQFLDRVFTPREQEYCGGKVHCLAGRFAAKEAILKALGTGLRGMRWTDIEILPNYLGKPEVKLSGPALEIAAEMDIAKILVSISHDRGRAVAFAVAAGKER
ncbi:Holo-(acyl-carrier-protein) synthase [Desulfotomaculum nigrificans CO-1-SRB]|uniref:Holo-[acyl-carrier-protein] synthase n=1 Tax=Desulfotomaculum nigrificans (strain DSM 14880 / VKM B-2319 / CO-1-SRB) TaxID=868595 RepID=F6B7D0_DESCC|nr:holo-ACP synthase [Desulfotomaculum nigrificans]AEF93380.1 Holo-(acyl-carrier-protein) synthase [Desulfotomaculum nigrificans CO-1-SRB]